MKAIQMIRKDTFDIESMIMKAQQEFEKYYQGDAHISTENNQWSSSLNFIQDCIVTLMDFYNRTG